MQKPDGFGFVFFFPLTCGELCISIPLLEKNITLHAHFHHQRFMIVLKSLLQHCIFSKRSGA